jgi:hypothetical protein
MMRLSRPFRSIAVLFVVAASSLRAQAVSNASAVVREAVAGLNARDLPRMLATYADRVDMHMVGGPRDSVTVVTRDQIGAMFAPFIGKMRPTDAIDILDQFAVGSFVTNHTRTRGDQTGATDAMSLYRVSNGRIDAWWTFGEGRADAATTSQAGAKSFLRNLIAAEEAFFADSLKYTPNFTRLRGGDLLRLPSGFRLQAITVRSGSLNAVIESTGMRCGIAVAQSNPVDATASDGTPVCKNK